MFVFCDVCLVLIFLSPQLTLHLSVVRVTIVISCVCVWVVWRRVAVTLVTPSLLTNQLATVSLGYLFVHHHKLSHTPSHCTHPHTTHTLTLHTSSHFKHTRTDVNECEENPCGQICTDLEGGYECSCGQGYRVMLDGSCEGTFVCI